MDDQEYLSIMAELRFIGSVGENQFLNCTTGKIVSKNIFSCVSRQIWYKQENGQTCSRYCKNVIIRALRLYDKYKEIEGMSEYIKSIKKYIEDAKIGMEHLKNTHANNTLAFATFDSIIDCIKQRID